MAEQTFKSPGFFEREIDLSQRDSEIVGVPAGVVGTADMGPAFVPVTVGSFADFERKFGSLSPEKFGPYAVREFLKHKTALTYIRVLGAGSNSTTAEFSNTVYGGIVKGAGFKIIGTEETMAPSAQGRTKGCVQFINARHIVQNSAVEGQQGEEAVGYPIFSQNRSYSLNAADDFVYLTRAMLFTPTGSRFEILSYATASYSSNQSDNNDLAMPNSSGMFKLVLSSSAGEGFASTDGAAGIKIFTASLDPVSDNYIGKILNTDPSRFGKEEHLLYADFPVVSEIAFVDNGIDVSSELLPGGAAVPSICLTSGSQLQSLKSGISGISFLDGYGRFDTRYKSPQTSYFISQPYGNKEYDLFKFECISDGAIANDKFKISITSLKKSTNPSDPYGTFTVQVRQFDDTDTAPKVLESYTQCTLNPDDENYIANKIGDFKAYFNFDAELESERKMMVRGRYPNNSNRIRVIMNPAVDEKDIPENALPFGFRGFGALKTNDTLTDNTSETTLPRGANTSRRLTFVTGIHPAHSVGRLTGSILPPVPFTFKVTRGECNSVGTFVGRSGDDERVDARYYWGAKFTRLPRTGTLSNALLRSNESTEINTLFRSYSKMLGIQKLDMVVTGAGADEFNENKFTLARVALPNKIKNNSAGNPDLNITANSHLTGTAKDHILNTAYIRNGIPDTANYTITDPVSSAKRLTFASLMTLTSSVYFNRFTNYAKFTNFFYGGFDGLNILNSDMSKMNDRSCSSDTGGMASGQTLDIGLNTTANDFGSGKDSSIVSSYRVGAKLLTDPMVSRVNIITIPGLRDSAITDYVFDRLSDYSKGFYVADIPTYNADGNRLFLGGADLPNVSKTSEVFSGRAIDNNYSAVYFPDVTIDDPINNRPVEVPASVAVMGALAYNDTVAYPWFAPAGFNRAALDFVSNVKVRLNQGDRDLLYEDRINPISTFPQAGYVIFGQKTLQLSRSALDRVNVRRMLLEVKRIVSQVAEKIVFEQNTPATRARFVAQVTPLLSTIQSQQGIDQFKVVMDSTNNTQEDIESNILNGKIVVVPTRAVEFVAIDFIITNAGVSFE